MDRVGGVAVVLLLVIWGLEDDGLLLFGVGGDGIIVGLRV